MQQKIIITNNNLLFQFSDHNNNLLVPKLWKSASSVIILIRSRGSAIKLYFFSCSMFLSKTFDVGFVLNILVWYIRQHNCVLYLVIT